MSKISIRFFNDKEVRAVWENHKWWFSVVDIVSAITNSPRPRVYWGTVKNRLKAQGNQLYSKCIQLKLKSNDGKSYATDCLTQDDISELVKNIPSKNALKFLDWFTYSDNTIDGQSKKKAYTFGESNLIGNTEIGSVKALQKIHAYIFGGLYDFAGQIRTLTISKGGFTFAPAQFLHLALSQIELMPETTFDEIADKYVEMNVAHPFMEGNWRSTRIWLDLMFRRSLKKCIDWSKINKNDYLNAMIKSHTTDSTEIKRLLSGALTNKINDREIFMKGIDYSYYYEQEDNNGEI
ncbi:MAG: Fic family protein [Christensenellaceae bacterium]|jgi:cell filamentation protein|nr:Fic family protein [Christensenellaceae bacterium]